LGLTLIFSCVRRDHISSTHEQALAQKLRKLEQQIETAESTLQSRLEKDTAALQAKIETQMLEANQVSEKRDQHFAKLKQQIKGNDESLGRSLDILQVRFESCSAEIERVGASVRDARQDAQRQISSTVQACEDSLARAAADWESTKSSIMKVRSEIELFVADELDAAAKREDEKLSARFSALRKSFDDRHAQTTQELQSLASASTVSLQSMETALRGEVSTVVDRADRRQQLLLGELRQLASAANADRQKVSDLGTQRETDEAKLLDLERRLVFCSQTFGSDVNARVDEVSRTQKVEIARVEDRVLEDVANLEKRLSARLDDAFAQLSASLDMYKHMRVLAKETGERAKGTEERLSKVMAVNVGKLEHRLSKVMAGNVGKLEPNDRPKSGVRPTEGEASAVGTTTSTRSTADARQIRQARLQELYSDLSALSGGGGGGGSSSLGH
jgi:hypothetical protein